MAIYDLLESMNQLANVWEKLTTKGNLDYLRIRDNDIKKFRELILQIKTAYHEKKQNDLKKYILEASTYFDGGYGGLCDMLFCKGNDNIPEGFTAEEANRIFNETLEDYFFNVLFWNTERKKAWRIYKKRKKIFKKQVKMIDKKYDKEHPDIAKKRDTHNNFPLMYYFHWDHDWFKDWTDLGELIAQKENDEKDCYSKVISLRNDFLIHSRTRK